MTVTANKTESENLLIFFNVKDNLQEALKFFDVLQI